MHVVNGNTYSLLPGIDPTAPYRRYVDGRPMNVYGLPIGEGHQSCVRSSLWKTSSYVIDIEECWRFSFARGLLNNAKGYLSKILAFACGRGHADKHSIASDARPCD